MELQVGMLVKAQNQQTYRILALVDHQQQVLVQATAVPAQPVLMIAVTAITQIVSADGVVGVAGADVRLNAIALAGCHYAPQIKTTLAQLPIGACVLLQREGNNSHDAKAVSVWTQQHAKLGYLPRSLNDVYAILMDQGHLLYGVVETVSVEHQQVTIILFESVAAQAGVPALRVRQQLAKTTAPSLAAVPSDLLMTPLGHLAVKSNGRPITYQVTALNPWLTLDDSCFVTKRYFITPNWSAVQDQQLVTCAPNGAADVVDAWNNPTDQAVILTNPDSFYVVGISTKTMTGDNDNLPSDRTQAQAIYRVGKVADHQALGFVVSWVSYGDPHAQIALNLALAYPEKAARLPYVARTAHHQQATFNRAELAALLVSGLPNQQLGLELEPSVTPFTIEKLRTTLGDEVYHGLAGYQRYVHLAAGSADGVDQALLQALIHATLYHEIASMRFHLPTLGIVNQPIYPFQLFSDYLNKNDPQATAMLAFYNFEAVEVQEVPVKEISALAIIDQPEHPQQVLAPDEPDWLQIFMHRWQD
jgi:pimeloyl-ACP methyl ester carboxylesterase